MLVCGFSHNFAHETAGAARTRSSLRPLFSRRDKVDANLGRIAPRERKALFGSGNTSAACSPSSPAHAGDPVRRGLSAQSLLPLEYWIARSSRATTSRG